MKAFAVSLTLLGCGTASPPRAAPPAAGPPAAASPASPAAHAHAHHGMPMRFEHAEDWAKHFDDPSRDAWQHPDDVLAALGLRAGMTVADVGAGTGYFTVRLARAVPGGQVIATDIEPDMIRYLRERAERENLPNVRPLLAAEGDPRLPPASVDRILIVDTWHHIGDRARYAAGLAAALRPGGQLAIVDFTASSSHGPPKELRLSPEQVIAELRAAGLDASVSPVHLPEQYIVIGVRR